MLTNQYQIQQNMQTGSAGIQIFEDINTSANQTVRIGEGAGKLSYGTGNAFAGYQAGEQNLDGSYNTFVGYQAGQYNESSSSTTLVGAFAGMQNTNGNETVFVGFRAGEFNLNGDQNVGVGAFALRENSSGSGTTAVGWSAGERNLDGDYNTMIGAEAGQNNRSGNFNTMAGYRVGRAAFAGHENTFFGAYAGYSNEYGSDNCLIGYKAGLDVINGDFNIAIGAYSLSTGRMNPNVPSDCNVVIGAFTNTTGSGNVVLGINAGSNSTGDDNVLIGKDAALAYMGHKSVVVGSRALIQGSGECNTIVGYGAAPNFVQGSNNVFIGTGIDTYSQDTSYAIIVSTCNVQTSSRSIAIGEDIDNTRSGSILVGFDVNTDADNTIVIGNILTIRNAVVFKDPLNYSYIDTIGTKANQTFGPTQIDYSQWLAPPTSYSTTPYVIAGAGQNISNLVSSSGNPRATLYPYTGTYSLVSANGEISRAVVHYASSLLIGSSEGMSEVVPLGDVAKYYSVYGTGYTVVPDPAKASNINPADSIFQDTSTCVLNYSGTGVSNVVTNLTAFGTSNSTYSVYLQKQVQNAYFKYNPNDVLANNINSTTNTVAYWVDSDPSRNVYVTGLYTSPRPTQLQNLDKTNSAFVLGNSLGISVFLVRYNSSGSVTGATKVEGASSTYKANVSADTGGYTYLAGEYSLTGTLSNLSGTQSAISLQSTATPNAFVVKYAPDGNVIGAAPVKTQAGSADVSSAYRVYADTASNLFVTGFYTNAQNRSISLYNLDGTASAKTLQTTTSSSTNAFILRYSSNGDLVATTSFLGMNPDNPTEQIGGSYARSVHADPYGNVYVVGDHRNRTSTQPIRNLDAANASSAYSLPVCSNVSGYIIRYSPAGLASGLAVMSQLTGVVNPTTNAVVDGFMAILDVKTDGLGNVYVTGNYLSSLPVPIKNLQNAGTSYSLAPSYTGAVFLIKYDLQGNVVGATTIDSGTSYTLQTGFCITCDTNNRVYITGAYNASAEFSLKNLDGSGSTYKLPATLGNAAFMVGYDMDGAVIYKNVIDGNGVDIGFGAHFDNANDLYWTGTYQSIVPVPLYNLTNNPGDVYLPATPATTTLAYIIKYRNTQIVTSLVNGPLDGSVHFGANTLNTAFVGEDGLSPILFGSNAIVKYVVETPPRYGTLTTYIHARSVADALLANSSNLSSNLVYSPIHEYAYAFADSNLADAFTLLPYLQVANSNGNAYGITSTSVPESVLTVQRPYSASNFLSRNSVTFSADGSTHTHVFSSNDFVEVPNGTDDDRVFVIQGYDSAHLDLQVPYPPGLDFTYSNLRSGHIRIGQKTAETSSTTYSPLTGFIIRGDQTSNYFSVDVSSIPSTCLDVQNIYGRQLTTVVQNTLSATYTLPSQPLLNLWTVHGTSNGDLYVPNGATNLNQCVYRNTNPFMDTADTVRLVVENSSKLQEVSISFSNASSFIYHSAQQAAITCDVVTAFTSNTLYTGSNTEALPIRNTCNLYTSNVTIRVDTSNQTIDSSSYVYSTFALAGSYNSAYGYSNVWSFVSVSNMYPIDPQAVGSGGQITILQSNMTSNTVVSYDGSILGTPSYTYTLLSSNTVSNIADPATSYTSNIVTSFSNVVFLAQAYNYDFSCNNQQQPSFYNYGILATESCLLLHSSNTASNSSAHPVASSILDVTSNLVTTGTNTFNLTTSNILLFLERRTSNAVMPVTRALMHKKNGAFTFGTRNGYEMVLSNQGPVSSWTQGQIDSGLLYLQLPATPSLAPVTSSFVIQEATTSTSFQQTMTLYNSNAISVSAFVPTTYNLTYADRYTSSGRGVKGIYNLGGLVDYVKNNLGISGFAPNEFCIAYMMPDTDHLLLNSSLEPSPTAPATGSSYLAHTRRARSNITLYLFAKNASADIITNILGVPVSFEEKPPSGIPSQGINHGVSLGAKNRLDPFTFLHSWSNLGAQDLQISITSTLSSFAFEITSNQIALTDANKQFTQKDCLDGRIWIRPLTSSSSGTLAYNLVDTGTSTVLYAGLTYPLSTYTYYAFPTSYEVGSQSSLTTILYGPNQVSNVFSPVFSQAFQGLVDSTGSPVPLSDLSIYIEQGPTRGVLCDSTRSNIPYKSTLSNTISYLSYTPDDILHDTLSFRIQYKTVEASPAYTVGLSNYALPMMSIPVEVGQQGSNYPLRSFMITTDANYNHFLADGNSFQNASLHVPVASNVPMTDYTAPVVLYNRDGGVLVSTTLTVPRISLSSVPSLLTDSVTIQATEYSQTSLSPLLRVISTTDTWGKNVEFVLTVPAVEGVEYATEHGVVMKKSYVGGKLQLTPVSHFTKQELLEGAIVYQHIGTGAPVQPTTDRFSCYATCGPYAYNAVRITVTLQIQRVPYITSIADDYVYYSSVAQASAGINPLDGFVTPGVTEGDLRYASNVSFSVIRSSHVEFVNASSNVIHSFSVADMVQRNVGYRLLPSYLNSSSFSNLEPVTFSLSPNGLPSSTTSNELVYVEPYRGQFEYNARGFVNIYESSNTVLYPADSTQDLYYAFGTPEVFGSNPVEFIIQVRPSQALSTVGMTGTELAESAFLRTFAFQITIGDALTSSNLLEAAFTHSNVSIHTPNHSYTHSIEGVFAFDGWNSITVSTIDTEDATRSSILINQGTRLYLEELIPSYRIANLRVHVDETSGSNFTPSYFRRLATNPNGDLPLTYLLTNLATTLYFRNLEIDIYQPLVSTQEYDPNTNNVIIGKDILVKGTDNITLGKKFSTSGQNNIIIGNYIGVDRADPLGTNDVFESIIIGNNSFLRGTIRDIIAIGNSNLNDLSSVDPATLNEFISHRPILIGNEISKDYIQFHINLANTFLRTNIGAPQVYLGLAQEKVAIGYTSNEVFQGYQDLYVAHGIRIGPSNGSGTYALSIAGDVNVEGTIYTNGATLYDTWKYTLERYNSNVIVPENVNMVDAAVSLHGTGPIFFNSVATSPDGTLYLIGSYNCGIPYTVSLFNLDGTQSAYTLPNTYYGFVNLGTSFMLRYNAAGTLDGFNTMETQFYGGGKSVCSDSTGAVYTTGYYQTGLGVDVGLRDLNSNALNAAYTLPANYNIGSYIVRYGVDGAVSGATSINSAYSSNLGTSICTDGSNIYAGGWYNSFYLDPATFLPPDPTRPTPLPIALTNLDNTSSVFSLPGTNYEDDGYVIKYGSNSILAATAIIGSSQMSNLNPLVALDYIGLGRARVYAMATDTSGNLFVGGTYTAYTSIPLSNLNVAHAASAFALPVTGVYDAGLAANTVVPAGFVISYQPDGTVSGAMSIFSQVSYSNLDRTEVLGVYASPSNLYVTGFYSGLGGYGVSLKNLDGSSSAYGLPATSASSCFLVSYNSNGDVSGAMSFGGDTTSRGEGITSDRLGYAYLTGRYSGASSAVSLSNLDGTPSTVELPATGTGTNTNTFILKIGADGVLQKVAVQATNPPSLDLENRGTSVWCDTSLGSPNTNDLYLVSAYQSTTPIVLNNLNSAVPVSSYIMPASANIYNNAYVARYKNEYYVSSNYDYNIPVIYAGQGSNVGIGTSFVPYGTSLKVEGNELVTGTLTASNLNFLGNLYQNGELYIGSQWTTSGCNIYYAAGSVGMGKDPDAELYTVDVVGNINFTGNIYQNGVLYPFGAGGYGDGSNASNIWVRSSNVLGVIPAGAGIVSYSPTSNAIFRHSDNNVDFAFDLGFSITTGSGGTGDYKLLVPFVVDTSYYLNNTIIGSAMCLVKTGGLSNYFPLTIRSPIGANQSNVVIRLMNGTTETSLATLASGTDVQVSGMFSYVSTSILPSIGLGGGGGGRTWLEVVGGMYNSNLAGNVGIGTTRPRYKLDVAGSINFTSNMYQKDKLIDLTGIELVRSNLDKINPWVRASNLPRILLPSPGTFSYSSASNAMYRHIDNDVEYSFCLEGTVAQASGAGDYTISLPVPIHLGMYASNCIIANLWSRVSSGSLVNYIPISVSTLGVGESNALAVRFVNGTTETPLSILSAGTSLQLSGTIDYVSTVYPRSGIFLSNVCYQDDDGHVGFNTLGPLRGQVDIVGNSNETLPALYVEQAGINSNALYVAGRQEVTGDLIVSGNVGIGTTLPASKLDVYGNLIVSNNVGIGTTIPTALLEIAAGTSTVAPLLLKSGTNLGTARAGAIEYDGTKIYGTIDTTSGRGYVPTYNVLRLTGDGSLISGTTSPGTSFFGTTSAINLAASGIYEIEAYCYFTKNTAGTVTVTLNTSLAVQNLSGTLDYGAGAGGTPTGAANRISLYNSTTTANAFAASVSLTTNVKHAFIIRAIVEANASASTLSINVHNSTGSMTPLRTSYYKVNRLPSGNSGIYS